MKKLVFANQQQVILWNKEMRGQVSDGMWENSTPHGHWVEITNVNATADSNPDKQGCFGFTPQRRYNFANTQLLDIVGGRALEEVQKDDPNYNWSDMVRDLKQMSNIVAGKQTKMQGPSTPDKDIVATYKDDQGNRFYIQKDSDNEYSCTCDEFASKQECKHILDFMSGADKKVKEEIEKLYETRDFTLQDIIKDATRLAFPYRVEDKVKTLSEFDKKLRIDEDWNEEIRDTFLKYKVNDFKDLISEEVDRLIEIAKLITPEIISEAQFIDGLMNESDWPSQLTWKKGAPTRRHRKLTEPGILGTISTISPEGKEKYFDYDRAAAYKWANMANVQDIRYYKGKLYGIHPEKIEPKKSKGPDVYEEGPLKINKGKISYNGKPIGTINYALQHGYHPSIELAIDGKPSVWMERDTPDVVQAAVREIKKILKMSEYIEKELPPPGPKSPKPGSSCVGEDYDQQIDDDIDREDDPEFIDRKEKESEEERMIDRHIEGEIERAQFKKYDRQKVDEKNYNNELPGTEAIDAQVEETIASLIYDMGEEASEQINTEELQKLVDDLMSKIPDISAGQADHAIKVYLYKNKIPIIINEAKFAKAKKDFIVRDKNWQPLTVIKGDKVTLWGPYKRNNKEYYNISKDDYNRSVLKADISLLVIEEEMNQDQIDEKKGPWGDIGDAIKMGINFAIAKKDGAVWDVYRTREKTKKALEIKEMKLGLISRGYGVVDLKANEYEAASVTLSKIDPTGGTIKRD